MAVNINRTIRTLERRLGFLRARLADYKGKDPSHDKAEAAALRLVIELVKREPEAVKRTVAALESEWAGETVDWMLTGTRKGA